MPVRLGRWFVVLAVVFATGSHWFFLQSIAWVGMAVNYSKTAPISVALKKTFDGDHPCKLCLAVKEGKQEEKKQELLKLETKLDFLCLQPFSLIHPELRVFLLSVGAEFALPRAQAPPAPPPRFA